MGKMGHRIWDCDVIKHFQLIAPTDLTSHEHKFKQYVSTYLKMVLFSNLLKSVFISAA